MLPCLPYEIWEGIIDWLLSDRQALRACAVTCRAWYYPCMINIMHTIILSRRAQLDCLRALLVAKSYLAGFVHTLYITRNRGSKAAPHLAAFPSVLVGKLPKLKTILVDGCSWDATAFHPTFYWLLSEFKSVTELCFIHTTFSNIEQFGRVVCAFPNLSTLSCHGACWAKARDFNWSAYKPPGRRVRLTNLTLNPRHNSRQRMVDTVQWLLKVADNDNLTTISLPAIMIEDAEAIGIGQLWKAAGPVLREVSMDFDASGLTAEQAQRAVRGHLSLEYNTALRSLELALFIDDASDQSWVPTLLLQISSYELREVTFVITLGDVASDKGLELFPCSRIDEILCRPQFAQLAYVFFPDNWLSIDAVEWQTMVQKKFPKLQKRGVIICADRP